MIKGAEKAAIKLNSEFKPLENVFAEDTQGNPLEVRVIENTVNEKITGKYKVVYEVTDVVGNTTKVEREVTVYGTPSIIGTEDKAIKLGSEFNPLDGVFARDTEGNELEISVVRNVDLYKLLPNRLLFTLEGVVRNTNTVDNIDVYKLGAQKLTYIVEDAAGNIITVDRIITVYGEPTIIEANDKVIKLGSEFDLLDGVIVKDTEGKELNISVLANTLDVNNPGKYTVTYTAEDVAGNIVTLSRVVTVYGDPVITGANETILRLGSEFNPLDGVVAKDTEGKELNISVSGNVDINKPGEYILTYTATDILGNVTTVDRLIMVEGIIVEDDDFFGDNEENPDINGENPDIKDENPSINEENSDIKDESTGTNEEKPVINKNPNLNNLNTGDKGAGSYLLLAISSMIGLLKTKKSKKK